MLDEFELDLLGKKRISFPEKSTEKPLRSDEPWYYLGLIGEIGFAIAVPIAEGQC